MAEVFKAKTVGVEGFERIVALKRILPSIAEDEEFIMEQIQRYSSLTERNLDMIESLIKKGYAMSSPEVKRLQQKLHDLEVKSNFWRSRMLKYL